VTIAWPGQAPISCRLHDISEGGCSLDDTVTTIPVGQIVRISGSGVLSGCVLSARLHAGPPSEGRARLIFEGLDDVVRATLRGVLDSEGRRAAA
jgi:hypothetical protein